MTTREEFMESVRARVGDDTSDEALAFVEKMASTYDELTADRGEDWRQKYEENDAMWREKYRNAFFNTPAEQARETKKPSEKINFKDLFE